MLTYGDGIANIDIRDLVHFRSRHGRAATVTAVQPPGRFGALELGDRDVVAGFREKPDDEAGWINGGFFVLEFSIFDVLEDDRTVWERKPLATLAGKGQLMAYKHSDFW